MTKLSSAELRKQICSAGIRYLPAEQVFYKSYPYKIELSPRFKGLGGVSGKRGCQIDIADPVRARQKLEEFNMKMERIISNVEYRNEIKNFINRLPNIEYKTRMGGENTLFYFQDPNLVQIIIDRYKDVINSVTGPFNDDHTNVINQSNVVMRDKLYYGMFRYVISFTRTDEFVEKAAPQLLATLEDMDPTTWRAAKLRAALAFHKIHGTLDNVMSGRIGRPPFSDIQFPHRAIIVYLSDPQDYVYLKLLAGEYVVSNHEIVLFDELT